MCVYLCIRELVWLGKVSGVSWGWCWCWSLLSDCVWVWLCMITAAILRQGHHGTSCFSLDCSGSLSLSFCGFALSVYVLCVLRHCLALLLFLVFMAHFLHFPIFLAGLIFCPSFYFYAGSLSWLHRSKAILNWLYGKQGLLLWVVRTRTVVADGQSIYTGFLQLNVFLWSGTTTLVQTEILYLYYWIINHEIWYI